MFGRDFLVYKCQVEYAKASVRCAYIQKMAGPIDKSVITVYTVYIQLRPNEQS